MAEHIPQPTVEDAQARSRALWEAYLGRPKKPEDVTEYLYPVRVRTGDPVIDDGLPDGVDVALFVPQRDKYLDRLARQNTLTVDEATVVSRLYPAWQANTTYKVDEVVAYAGAMYRAISAHTSRLNSPPDIGITRWVIVAGA